MHFNFRRTQGGFTLVELLVVMLVLVALSSITLDFTKDFAFQGRYEVTKDRYDKIKRAIIGRPDVLINGQPDISGFVADMGRLPENMRELTQAFYCLDGTTVTNIRRPSLCTGSKTHQYSSTPCVNPSYITELTCGTGSSTWLGQKVNSGFTYDWNGPYLNIKKASSETTAFLDGWGNTNNNLNYGWNFCLGDAPVITTIATCYGAAYPTAGTNKLDVNSKGKDLTDGGTVTYDIDYPDSTLLTVEYDDWGVNPSTKIAIHIPSALHGQCDRSICNDPRFTSASCGAPKSEWFSGSCSDGTRNEVSCIGGNTWTSLPQNICSNPAYSTEPNCNAGSAVWQPGLCSDPNQLTLSACTTASETWSPGICNNAAYSTNSECIAPNGAMQAASIVSQESCKSGGGIWTDQQINIFARLRYRSVDSTGKTIVSENDSADFPFSLDGNARTLAITNFGTNRVPIGSAELSVYAKIMLAGASTPKLLSGICKSNTATPFSSCGVVGGDFDDDTKLCFNSAVSTCISANDAIMIYPVKLPTILSVSSHGMQPIINW